MIEARIYVLLGKKLSNEATAGELVELELLLKDNAVDPSDLEALKNTWQSIPVADDAVLDEHWRKISDRIQPGAVHSFADNAERRKKIFSVTRIWAAASVLLLALTAGLWWLKKEEKANPIIAQTMQDSVIVAHNGVRERFMLPDSTTVHLNSGSRLTYRKDFGNGNREVWLDGEAFFEVTKDAAHPFLVNTKRITVKVLGTVFNVKAYDTKEDIETTVVEGKVEVSLNESAEKKVILLPNEKIALKNNAIEKEKVQTEASASNFSYEVKTVKPVLKEVDVPEEIAWVKEKVVFSDEPFEMVALKMERWYDVHFYFENENLKNILMSGDFENVSVDEALRILQMMVGFNYTINGDKIYIR